MVAREYSLGFSRLHLHAGTAVIELDNFGQDPHDLRVQRSGAKHISGLGTIARVGGRERGEGETCGDGGRQKR